MGDSGTIEIKKKKNEGLNMEGERFMCVLWVYN